MRLRAETFGGVGRALSSPHYRFYACGHIANVFGWWGNRLGIGWLTWELTQSFGWLGIVAFAGMIPVTIVAPIAGVIADRYGHRQIAFIASAIGGTVTLTITLLAFAGLMTVPLLLVLSILQGVAFGTEFPARQALIPQLVPRENVSAALAFNSTTFQVGTFIGPVIAGWLITHYGSGAAIAMYAFSNYWMALMISLLRFRPPPRETRENPAFFSQLAAGFRYIAGMPALRLLLVVQLMSGVLLRPYTELMSGFAAAVFNGGPEALGALTAASGFGALVSGIFLSFRGRTKGLVTIMLFGAISGSIALAVFSMMTNLTAGVVMLAIAAMLLLGCHVGAYSLVQNATSAEMRGRVISVNVSISIGGPALGALMIGWLAELIGLQGAVAASALTATAVVVALMPAIRREAPRMEAD